jgi:hypothetical protein
MESEREQQRAAWQARSKCLPKTPAFVRVRGADRDKCLILRMLVQLRQ